MRSFIPLSIFFTLVSCSQFETKSELRNAATEIAIQPVVVVAGGFSSCPDEGLFDRVMRASKTAQMYDRVWQVGIIDRLARKYGTQPAILTLCYSGPTRLAEDFAQSLQGRFAWNLNRLGKDSPVVRSFTVPQGELLQNISFLSHVKFELKKFIDRKEARGKDVKLYMIGHSYGGFTSLQLAKAFAEQMAGLATIDPISILRCQAQAMSTEPWQTATRQHKGCLEAPRDKYSRRSIEAMQNVLEASASEVWWYHSYQKTFVWLHSDAIAGPAPSAPENEAIDRRRFDDPLQEGDHHSQMGRARYVWERIAEHF